MTGNKAKLVTIQKLVHSLSLPGNVSELLCAGLPHALEERPEDRHPMQEVVLKMANEVLSGAQDEAQADEAARRSEAEAAQVVLEGYKAAVESAGEELAAAQSVVSEKKEALGERKKLVAQEEQIHKKAEATDKSKGKIMAGLEKERNQVAAHLSSVDEKVHSDKLIQFLEKANADAVVIASAPSVLAKEPSERAGFDLQVLSCLQDFLREKLAAVDAEIQAETADQADAHAEARGAFAILDLARDDMREATANLRKAQAALEAAREGLEKANDTVEQQEGVVATKRVEVSIAEDKARRCREALDLLKEMETGPEAKENLPPALAEKAPQADAVMAPVVDAAPAARSSRILPSPAVLLQSARNLLPSPGIMPQPVIAQQSPAIS